MTGLRPICSPGTTLPQKGLIIEGVLVVVYRLLLVGPAAKHDALVVVDHVWVGEGVLLLASSAIFICKFYYRHFGEKDIFNVGLRREGICGERSVIVLKIFRKEQ